MAQKKEVIDLYTADRIPTGQTILRGDKPPADRYRLVVHVCIFNSKGEMLIQKRKDDIVGLLGCKRRRPCVFRRYEPGRSPARNKRRTRSFDRVRCDPSCPDGPFSGRIRRFLCAADGCEGRRTDPAERGSRCRSLGGSGRDRSHDRRRELYPLSERPDRLSVFLPQRKKHVEYRMITSRSSRIFPGCRRSPRA